MSGSTISSLSEGTGNFIQADDNSTAGWTNKNKSRSINSSDSLVPLFYPSQFGSYNLYKSQLDVDLSSSYISQSGIPRYGMW